MTWRIGCRFCADVPRSKPSLAATRWVSSARVVVDRGSRTEERVPTIMEPTYSLGLVGAVDAGLG
jgi:hypothetical protein